MALLVLYILLLPCIEGQFRGTGSCPTGINEWKRRESLFQCPLDTHYHCILVYNTSQLYEACMVAGTIQSGKVGCPWILFYKDRPILGSKNSECPVTNPDCPPSDHRGFLTNQLYQYPACFIHRSARKSKITDLITTIPSTTSKLENSPSSSENTSDQNFGTWIVVLIVFIVVAIAVSLSALIVLKRKKKEISMSQQGFKSDTDHEREIFIKDRETVTPRVEGAQITIHNNKHDIDVEQSNEDVPSTTPLMQHQINMKQSNEDAKTTSPSLQQRSVVKHPEHDAKTTSPSLQQRSVVKHPEHDMKVQQSDPDQDSAKSTTHEDLSESKPVVKYSEDHVRAVISTILTLPNGIAEFHHLLGLLLQNGKVPDVNIQTLENLLRCNSNSFRLLEDSNGILFVIVYSSEAKICKTYNDPWRAGKCAIIDCREFHICLFNLTGKCTKSDCKLSNTYRDSHNRKLKEAIQLNEYSDIEMNIILLNQYPKICSSKDCTDENYCPYLHICLKFCNAKCNERSHGHSFNTAHNEWILEAYGIPLKQLWSGSETARCFSLANRRNRN